jgi:hypothetical protein
MNKGKPMRLTANSSKETLKARMARKDVFPD